MKQAEAKGLTPEEKRKQIQDKLIPLRTGLSASVIKAYEKYQRLRQENLKGPLAFCYISYLRSSVIERRPFFQIDLYDQQDRMDFLECCEPWDTDILTGEIYRAYPVAKGIKTNPNEQPDYEIEQRWLIEADDYYKLLGEAMAQLLEQVRLQLPKDAEFYFGEYMDDAVRI